MPSERVQRQIDRLLDEAEEAITALRWDVVRDRATAALTLDGENQDAKAYLASAEKGLGSPSSPGASVGMVPASDQSEQPTSFANGRYTVTRFLGEGGKKKVYLARDSLLDREVALALIKTEGLDEAARQRVSREAQAMGRLGAHPNIVTVFDIGEENSQPFLILPVMNGGDVEGEIEDAPEHRLALERAVAIAIDTCRGLEFSHAKGIVHRDLKPGNVWLTEDGRAMIGDFGLAVAVDKSRLTQAGMMVGTVNYMPPEQAMGGEVGPRSDLYSLGAMLYEMVCGRPPFVGDESVAIIGQHLNTPPVAPSWHRPDCPPALEVLILRLLEKDPTKRPASAEEVRQALEGVNTAARPRDPTVVAEVLTPGDNPLYRRTFVGRESEVRQLQQAFDAALSGQGGLVMVVGEPGIGKTALCEQLATYVALRGGKALVGHCYEEGSLSLPYLAFVEAMRSYVLAREPDGLRSDLGTGAADVARIVSEVRDRVQGIELRAAGDPEDDRWRLLQAVTSFLRNASTVQPLCIVLEDLHWADRGTLDLLLHASRNLQGARLLVVGTYRDLEVDRTHPLSSTLAELRRGETFRRTSLRGLSVDEVQRMINVLAGQETRWSFAEAVFRQTEGNPLFVQEVLRFIVEEGLIERGGGRWTQTGDRPSEMNIPEGLRDVIGKRISRLGSEANRILAIAAVIGRDFRLDVLLRVAATSEDELLTALDEAKAAAVIEERSSPGAVVTYRFSHAFFSQTLHDEISAPRRIRIHQQVARALEDLYRTRIEEHASELSEHFSHSSDPDDLTKAVRYGEMAAQRAINVFDYGEAARLLERAIDVEEVLDPDNRTRLCDLLISLGNALPAAGQSLRAAQYAAEEVWQLADSMNDHERGFQALQIAIQSLYRYSSLAGTRTPEFARWLERLERFPPVTQQEKVIASSWRVYESMTVDPGAFRLASLTTLELARPLNNGPLLFLAGWFLPCLATMAKYENERWLLAQEVETWPIAGVSTRMLVGSYSLGAIVHFGWGDRLGAELLLQRADELAERTREPAALLYQTFNRAVKATIAGDLEGAASAWPDLILRGDEYGSPGIGRSLALCWIPQVLYQLGRFEDASRAALGNFQYFEVSNPPWTSPFQAVVAAAQGRKSEARESLREFQDHLHATAEDDSWVFAIMHAVEAAIMIEDPAMVALFMERLRPAAGIAMELLNPTSTSRLLGTAACFLGNASESRAYFEESLRVCGSIDYRPEIALSRLGLAELLLEHYPDERDAAIEHLDFAIAELRDMKMQPALERALRHRGLLKA